MILMLCLPCGFGLRVNGEPAEVMAVVGPQSDLWPKGFRCARCEAPIEAFLESQVAGAALAQMQITNVTPSEALAASNGLGLPVERACTLEEIHELFQSRGVKRVVGTNIPGTQRCILDYLVLNDETKIYFGASTDGATVYRITRPHSYVESLE